MKQRYEIFEIYNGLFDATRVICVTDSLLSAIKCVELFTEASENNACYSYDFKKIDNDVDDVLDYYPFGLLDDGYVYDCKDYAEFRKLKENCD